MLRLIRVFAGRKVILLVLSWGGSFMTMSSNCCSSATITYFNNCLVFTFVCWISTVNPNLTYNRTGWMQDFRNECRFGRFSAVIQRIPKVSQNYPRGKLDISCPVMVGNKPVEPPWKSTYATVITTPIARKLPMWRKNESKNMWNLVEGDRLLSF